MSLSDPTPAAPGPDPCRQYSCPPQLRLRRPALPPSGLSDDPSQRTSPPGLSQLACLCTADPPTPTARRTLQKRAFRRGGERGRRAQRGRGGAAQGPEGKPKPTVSRRGSDKTKEEGDDEKEEVKSGGGSIKRRISLLLDSSSSPGGRAIGQVPEPRSPVQPIPEAEAPLGIKQRIKQLTEDTPPAQTPSPKLSLRPRPLPLDLTKRLAQSPSSEPASCLSLSMSLYDTHCLVLCAVCVSPSGLPLTGPQTSAVPPSVRRQTALTVTLILRGG